MVGEGGFREAVARFHAEVDAAVTRARRASSAAKSGAASFRADTAELAAKIREGRARPRRDELTTPELRTLAEDFRTAKGLTTERLPDGEELVARAPLTSAPAPTQQPQPVADEAVDDDDYFHQQQIMVRGPSSRPEVPGAVQPPPAEEPPAAAEPPAAPPPPPSRRPRVTRPSDDDDDFSQESIMFRNS